MKSGASQDKETGTELGTRGAKELAWLAENSNAVRAYNERIKKHGTLLKPIWLED